MTTSEQQKDRISQLAQEVWEWAWNIVGFTTKDEREYNQLARISKEIMIEGLKKLVSDGEFVLVKELREKVEKMPYVKQPILRNAREIVGYRFYIDRDELLKEIPKETKEE